MLIAAGIGLVLTPLMWVIQLVDAYSSSDA
jgi:hypothetical protein